MRSLRNGSDWSEGKEIKIEAKIEDSLFFLASKPTTICMHAGANSLDKRQASPEFCEYYEHFGQHSIRPFNVLDTQARKYVSCEIRERANV